jgi:hypothetical protein
MVRSDSRLIGSFREDTPAEARCDDTISTCHGGSAPWLRAASCLSRGYLFSDIDVVWLLLHNLSAARRMQVWGELLPGSERYDWSAHSLATIDLVCIHPALDSTPSQYWHRKPSST